MGITMSFFHGLVVYYSLIVFLGPQSPSGYKIEGNIWRFYHTETACQEALDNLPKEVLGKCYVENMDTRRYKSGSMHFEDGTMVVNGLVF